MDIQHSASAITKTLHPAFYAGLTTEAEQALGMRWGLWYLAEALTKAFPLYVTRVNDASETKGFDLSVESGYVVMHVRSVRMERGRMKGEQGYEVAVNTNMVTLSALLSPVIQSINLGYILKNLTDKSKEAHKTIQNAIDRFNLAARNVVFKIADRLADHAQDKVKDKGWTLNSELATALLVNVFENKTLAPDSRTGLEDVYSKYLEREKILHQERGALRKLLTGNKWLIGYDQIRSRYIVGAVDSTWMADLTDRRIGGEWLCSSDLESAYYSAPLLPLRSYKSLDDLPDSIRDSVKGAMLMTKLQMGEAFHGKPVDPAGLMPDAIAKPSGTYTILPNNCWYDEGGIVYKESFNSRHIVFELLDQT